MPRPDRETSRAGFRQQLLARLRSRALQERVSAQRLQQRVAFERLLERLNGQQPAWVLKGGFALELRYGWEHRPTRDIDLRFGNEIELDDLVPSARRAQAPHRARLTSARYRPTASLGSVGARWSL